MRHIFAMRIALLQLLAAGSAEENRKKGEEYCRRAKNAGADIALFPEMWSCGYRIPEDTEELKRLALPAGGEQTLTTETVDEVTCNPLKVWHDLGEPRSLSANQLRLLRQAGQPAANTAVLAAENGECTLQMTLRQNAVVRFTLSARNQQFYYGYDYTWYQQHS